MRKSAAVCMFGIYAMKNCKQIPRRKKTENSSLCFILPSSFNHYLHIYQEGAEGGGSQVRAGEFQLTLGLLPAQTVRKKAQSFP